jgi:hypothetical protein
MNELPRSIIASILSGLFAVLVFIIVANFVPVKQRLELFGIVNKWLVLAAFLYTFGFVKHQIGYYFGVESSYCEQTDICNKRMKQTQPTLVENAKQYLSFAENVWLESVGEGLVFLFVGLPVFLLLHLFSFNTHRMGGMTAAFITGVLAGMFSEYSGIHEYFCILTTTTLHLRPLCGQKIESIHTPH